jgi:hypothetical protein
VYLSNAKVLFQGLEYEKCIRRLQKTESLDATVSERAEIQLYLGLCQAGRGDLATALTHFRTARALDASLKLPPGLGPKTTQLFESARQATTAAEEPVIDAPRVVEAPPAEAPAPPQLVPAQIASAPLSLVTPPEPEHGPRWVGHALVGIGAASLGTAIFFGVSAKSSIATAQRAQFDSEMAAASARGVRDAQIANACFIGAGVAAAGAALTYFLTR